LENKETQANLFVFSFNLFFALHVVVKVYAVCLCVGKHCSRQRWWCQRRRHRWLQHCESHYCTVWHYWVDMSVCTNV